MTTRIFSLCASSTRFRSMRSDRFAYALIRSTLARLSRCTNSGICARGQRISQIRPSRIGCVNHRSGAVNARPKQVPAGRFLPQLQYPRLIIASVHERGDSGVEHRIEIPLVSQQVHADSIPTTLQVYVHVRQPGHHALPFRVNDLRVARDRGRAGRSCIFDLAASKNYRGIFCLWLADSINNFRINNRDGLFLCCQPRKRAYDDHPQRQQRASPIHGAFSWTIRMKCSNSQCRCNCAPHHIQSPRRNLRGKIPVEKLMTETSKKPRIAIGADDAGFLVKETIRKYLEAAGYAVDDQGTSSEESVDYPDYGKAVGERVVSKQADLGIAVCGSGIGISIAANKVPGIRAALAHDVTTARLAREHNDANVLALGGRIVTAQAAVEMVQTFLTTAYLGGRHQRRLDKITRMEGDS